jgi:hypothetical protein
VTLPFRSRHRALKARPCDARPGCTIEPGDTYEVAAWPPWVLAVDDVDDDRNPIGSPLGHWARRAFHSSCEAGLYYGDAADEAADRETMARVYGED